MFENAYLVDYLLSKIGADTTENEPTYAKILTEIWQILAKISGPRTQLGGLWGGRGGVREHALNAGQLEREGAGTREEGQPHSPDTRLSVREDGGMRDAANFRGLVLGCIEAK